MIYRISPDWIAQQKKTGKFAAIVVGTIGLVILLMGLAPHTVSWATFAVASIVAFGLIVGLLAGRMTFRARLQRWEAFQVQLSNDELVRTIGAEIVRIQRANVTSIREFPRRGIVVSDAAGWRIFVPTMIENFEGFREEILKWSPRHAA